MSALADVARIAGVSKATASRALSGTGYVSPATRTKVVEAASHIGYVVSSNASSLVTGRTRNVGVVIPYLNRWFFAEVLDGIEAALIGAGYDLTLYRLSDDPVQRRRVFDYFLVRKRVDAVIAVSIALAEDEVAMLHALGKPIAGIGGPIAGAPSLSIDDARVARLATEHLLALGHRRIMHVGGDQAEQMDFSVHEKRLRGFREAISSAGLSSDLDFRATSFSIPGGYEVGLDVLGNPHSRPTAIMAGCDEIAIGIIIAARQLGIQVPAQLSVVGIDDHELAAMFGLTTVRQDPRAQGTRAVSIIMDELSDEVTDEIAESLVVTTSLIVRSSTTAPPVPVH